MKTHRVLYVIRGIQGGTAVVVYQLAKRLDRTKYEPIVAFDTNQQSHFRQKIVESGIRTLNLVRPSCVSLTHPSKVIKQRNIADRLDANLGKKARGFYLSLKSFFHFIRYEVSKIRLYVQAINENGIDLVHTNNNLNSGKPEIIAAWITGTPCISHTHGFLYLTYFDRIFSVFVHSFIYISREIANYAVSQGNPPRKGTIIHNGVDIAEFSLSSERRIIREELGIKSNEYAVGIIGRIDWWKGHEYFLEAIAKIANQVPYIKGLIIGELDEDVAAVQNRQYLGKLQGLVISHGLTERITFTGFRSDIPRVIAALDVVVHASSRAEPFGLVIIEAMAAGKPVIATAAGGVLDIIEDQVNGLLIPCKDSEAMARAVFKMLQNKDKTSSLGVAAKQRAAERFSVERQVGAVEKLYDSILKD